MGVSAGFLIGEREIVRAFLGTFVLELGLAQVIPGVRHSVSRLLEAAIEEPRVGWVEVDLALAIGNPGHWHEQRRQQLGLDDLAAFSLEKEEGLVEAVSQRNNQFAAFAELVEQGLRNA